MVKLYTTSRDVLPRICLTDPEIVSAWCAELQCTECQLRSAVYAVGSQPYWIRRFFQPVSSLSL